MRFALPSVSRHCFGRALRDGGRLAAILDSFGECFARLHSHVAFAELRPRPPFLDVLEVYDLARIGTRSIVPMPAVFTFHWSSFSRMAPLYSHVAATSRRFESFREGEFYVRFLGSFFR